jgi:phosphoglycolate phosphatase-like HAD superfamily hydrolase
MKVKKLRVFDFDDTLVKTNSFIYITNNGINNKLSPGEYAVYQEKSGDIFDYSDFEDVKNPKQIKQMTMVFKRIANKRNGKGLFILTARAAYKPVRKYLKDIGIDMENIFVKALGSNNPNEKANWIKNKIENENYNDIYFADDSEKNINTVKKMLLKQKNIKYKLQKINYD